MCSPCEVFYERKRERYLGRMRYRRFDHVAYCVCECHNGEERSDAIERVKNRRKRY